MLEAHHNSDLDASDNTNAKELSGETSDFGLYLVPSITESTTGRRADFGMRQVAGNVGSVARVGVDLAAIERQIEADSALLHLPLEQADQMLRQSLDN